ncbi:MAG: tetratricopeptide repeat protein [Sedimenticola sp.]|nr:tetratricopeptide repeat protein [Sedimenticola sp.]
MSLINQMLRDLDQREQADETPRVIKTPQPVPSRPTQRQGSRWPIWALLLLAAAVTVIALQPRLPLGLSSLFGSPADTSETALSHEPAVAEEVVPLTEPAADNDNRPTPAVVESITQHAKAVEVSKVQSPAVQPPATDSMKETKDVAAITEQAKTLLPSGVVEQQIASKGPRQQRDEAPSVEQPSLADRTHQVPERPQVAQSAPVSKASANQPEPADEKQSSSSARVSSVVADPIQVKKVSAEKIQASSDEVFQTAILHLNEGRLGDAESSLRHVLELDHQNHEARRYLGMLLLNAGDRSEFFSLLNEGLQIAPGHAPFVLLVGRAFIETGEQLKAISLLEQRLPATGNDVELLAMLGSLYQQAGQYATAIKTYRQLVAQQPDNARAVAGLAISLDATGEHEQALVLYRQVLDKQALPVEVSEYARQRVLSLSAER